MTGTLLGTVLRGLRSRALLTVGSVVLAALAIGSAALGPMFQVAATNSYLVTRLNEAPNPLTGLSSVFTPGPGFAGPPQRAVDLAVNAADAHDHGPFLRPQTQLETPRLATVRQGAGILLSSPDVCAHVELVSGTCPSRAGDALLLQADLEFTGRHLGDTVDLSEQLAPVTAAATVPGRLVTTVTVVGTYRPLPDEADYWFDLARLASSPAQLDPRTGIGNPYLPAPFLVDRSTFAPLVPSQWLVRVDSRLDVPPDWSPRDLSAAISTAGSLADVEQVAGGTLRSASINDLASIAAEVRGQQATARSSIAPAVLSLVLVALALLLRLMTASSELRLPELALASLRGLPDRRLWALGLTEPLLVIGLAIPLGAVLGPLLALVLVRWWLVPGLPLPWPSASLLAATSVAVAAAVVAGGAVGLVLRMSLASQLTGVRRPTKSGRPALVAQLLLAALVVSVLAAKLTGGGPGRPDATDLILPVLLAVAAGVLATRVIAAAALWWTRHRPATRSLAVFVAARAVARRREGTLVVLPISAAIAVCVFGAGVYASAAEWRHSVAATRAPAAEVWTSDKPMGEVVGLTRDLDPRGEHLMAATTLLTTGSQYVVVDATRLAAVAGWPRLWTPGTSAQQIASLLTPTATVPTLTGARVGLTLAQDTGADLTVDLRLVDRNGEPHSFFLGPFTGPETRLVAATPYCRQGCRLEGLTIGGPAAQPVRMTGQVQISRIDAGGRPVQGALAGAGWVRAPGSNGASALQRVDSTGPVLRFEVDSQKDARGDQGIAELSTGAPPARVPALAGRDAITEATSGELLGPAGIDVAGVLTSESVPLLGPVGVLVDYSMLSLDRDLPDQQATSYVLADDGTTATLRTALVERGFTPSVTLAGEQRALDQSAYALALRLYAVVAVLVLLLALAGLVVSTAVQLPSRRRDAAALRVVGVRRRTVMSAVAVEFLVVLGGAAVAGIAAGSLAQYVVLRTITLGYVEGLSTPRLVAAVDWGQIGVWSAVTTVVLGVAAVLSAALTVRGARGSTLRENAR